MTDQPEYPEEEPVYHVEPDGETADLYDLLRRLEEIRRFQDQLDSEARTVTAALDERMGETRRALYTDPDGTRWKAVLIRPDDTVNVDLDRLRGVSPELYYQLTVRALDRKALNKALRAGLVSQAVAQAAMSTKPNRPSVRLDQLDQDTPEESNDRDD